MIVGPTGCVFNHEGLLVGSQGSQASHALVIQEVFANIENVSAHKALYWGLATRDQLYHKFVANAFVKPRIEVQWQCNVRGYIAGSSC
jgi:hypothetical protein